MDWWSYPAWENRQCLPRLDYLPCHIWSLVCLQPPSLSEGISAAVDWTPCSTMQPQRPTRWISGAPMMGSLYHRFMSSPDIDEPTSTLVLILHGLFPCNFLGPNGTYHLVFTMCSLRCCRVTTRAIFILLCCERSLTQMSLIPKIRAPKDFNGIFIIFHHATRWVCFSLIGFKWRIQSHQCCVRKELKEQFWFLKGCDLQFHWELLMQEFRIHKAEYRYPMTSPSSSDLTSTSSTSSCRLVTHLLAPRVEALQMTNTTRQRLQAFIAFRFTRTLRTASETAEMPEWVEGAHQTKTSSNAAL